MKAIKNVRIIRGGRILDETVLLYENRILDVASEVPAVADVLDGHGLYLCAGPVSYTHLPFLHWTAGAFWWAA